MRLTILSATAAVLALTACAEAETDTAEEPATTAEATETATAAPADAEAPAGGDQGFVDQAAASDMFEIESGKLAQSNGTSQAVKDFGAMLVTEHGKSTADLKAAAGEAGVTPAPAMTAKQQSDLTALRGAGDNFDSLFKTQQIAAHEAALALLQGQASGGSAAPLKAFATKTAPVVEKHLEMARKLP